MVFLTEDVPARGVPLPVKPGIRRIVADNPGIMTYHGTNTYLIEFGGGFVVIDPGPDDARHVNAIVAATGGKVSAIVLSHTHADHLGATAELKARTLADTYAFHDVADIRFKPDILLRHGDVVCAMTAIHTPGHASDHLCFARDDGILFSADHVMSWSSSIVSPPRGDMAAYLDSLELMLDRNDSLYLPGHGPPLPEPRRFVQELLHHRLAREQAIRTSLESGPMSAQAIADQLYAKTDPLLQAAAERNVLAHLLKLAGEGRVAEKGKVWVALP